MQEKASHKYGGRRAFPARETASAKVLRLWHVGRIARNWNGGDKEALDKEVTGKQEGLVAPKRMVAFSQRRFVRSRMRLDVTSI